MLVTTDTTAIKQTRWYEYAVRFVFGGVITVIAGAIGKKWGAAAGGLFLAYPAILPATATLLEKHTRERKQRKGLNGGKRGKAVAGADAAGAAMGSVGLITFGAIGWGLMPRVSPVITLLCGTLAWALTAVSVWILRKRRHSHR